MEVGFPVSSPGDFESVQTIARQIKNSRVCGLARCVDKDIDVPQKRCASPKRSASTCSRHLDPAH